MAEVGYLSNRPEELPLFLGRPVAFGRSTGDLGLCVIGVAVRLSVNYSQGAYCCLMYRPARSSYSSCSRPVGTQVTDPHFDIKYTKERAEIVKLAKRDDAESAELLRCHVREAMRLNPQSGGLFRDVVADESIPQGHGLPPLRARQRRRLCELQEHASQREGPFPPLAICYDDDLADRDRQHLNLRASFDGLAERLIEPSKDTPGRCWSPEPRAHRCGSTKAGFRILFSKE
jgi:hypothetical protein